MTKYFNEIAGLAPNNIIHLQNIHEKVNKEFYPQSPNNLFWGVGDTLHCMRNLSSWARDGTCARPCSPNHQTTRKPCIYLTTFFFFFSSLFICIIFVCTGPSLLCMGFSLVVASSVYARAAVLELTAVASLTVEHRL